MSNYAKIKNFDIANGEGIGVSLFLSGCDANPKCKGCFNSEAWDFNCGQSFTQETLNEIIKLMDNPHINHLSVLGGDPMADENIQTTLLLVKTAKNKYPNKKTWLWTWRLFDSIINDKTTYRREILNNIDVLVDGRFIEEQKDLTLKFRGSSNQRVINVPESLKQNKIVLYCD